MELLVLVLVQALQVVDDEIYTLLQTYTALFWCSMNILFHPVTRIFTGYLLINLADNSWYGHPYKNSKKVMARGSTEYLPDVVDNHNNLMPQGSQIHLLVLDGDTYKKHQIYMSRSS